MTLRVAIVGAGKIAHDQHVPAIAATDGVTLAAVADPRASQPDLPHFKTLEELLRDGPPIDAIAICTPPQMRRAQAALALAAGKHVVAGYAHSTRGDIGIVRLQSDLIFADGLE